MKLKTLTCELLKNARPQPQPEDDEYGLRADHQFDLVGYGSEMGCYWRLGRFEDPKAFYIEGFGDFHNTGKLDLDAITEKKKWNVIWDNDYYNDKGEKIILSVVYKDDKFDFTEYNKHSNEDGESILKRIQE